MKWKTLHAEQVQLLQCVGGQVHGTVVALYDQPGIAAADAHAQPAPDLPQVTIQLTAERAQCLRRTLELQNEFVQRCFVGIDRTPPVERVLDRDRWRGAR